MRTATGDFTIAAWVYNAWSGSGGYQSQVVAEKGDDATGYKETFLLTLGDGCAYNKMEFIITDTITPYQLCDPQAIVTNTWVHYVGTFNNSSKNMSLYKNGALIASRNNLPAGFTLSQTSKKLRIGCDYGGCPTWGWTTGWVGELDEVHIYNRALSAAEVQALYSGTAPQGIPINQQVTVKNSNGTIYIQSS